jgi:hypothetical protein
MALDESGGYDLARGFSTLIEEGRAQTQAIRDLQTSVLASLTMLRDTTMGASGRTPQSMDPALVRAASNVQPTPTAGQTVAAEPDRGGPFSGSGGGVVAQGSPGATTSQQAAPQADPQAGATKPVANAGAAAQSSNSSGLLDSVLNVLPFGNVVSDALAFGREQRNKNAEFQSIQGGSNLEQVDDRASMKKYQMSTAGMFTGAEAETVFKSATAMGYNDNYGGKPGEGLGRQDIANFAYKQKSATGASVEESMRNVEVFSRNSSAGLAAFSDALKAVGDAAGEAGANAMVAREHFVTMFGQGTSAGLGAGANAFAMSATLATDAYSREFQAGVDTSGMFSEGTMRMQSAMRGSTYGATITGAQAGVNTMAMNQTAAMEKLIGLFNPNAIKWAKEQIAANPNMSQEQVTDLGNKLMKKSGLDPEQIKITAETFTGKTYDNYELVMEDIVRFLMGQGIGNAAGAVGLLDEEGYESLGGGDGTATTDAYKARVESMGEGARVGMLENAMNQMDPDELDAQKIKINGKEMSLADAIGDDKAMKKISMGKGKFVGGEFDGKNIGEVYNEDTSDNGEGGDVDTTKTDVSVDVKIDLSQDAMEWFRGSYNVNGLPADQG